MVSTTYARRSPSMGIHQKIALALLTGLLFLRLPFLAGIHYFLQTVPDGLDPTWEIGTYLLTACLLWWERDRLAIFHIDGLAVAIVILFKPFETILLAVADLKSPLGFPNPLSLSFWVIAFGLALALLSSRSKLPGIETTSFGWFGIGIIAGIAMSLVLGYPMSLQMNPYQLGPMPPASQLVTTVLWRLPEQLGYAAVSEEPLFRGFLWGYLRKAGWQGIWIWLFQAALFTVGHIYYLNSAVISFWIIVPTGALVLGLLAWRSQSIATSMAAHATVNALLSTVGLLIAAGRL